MQNGKVFYAREAVWGDWGNASSFPHRIFLAGPTTTRPEVPSWRPEVMKLLGERLTSQRYILLNPEDRNGYRELSAEESEAQGNWEDQALDLSTVILFWIPRNLATLPGFTTNTEFGKWSERDPKRIVIGAPPDAAKMGDIRRRCRNLGIPVYSTRHGLVEACEMKIAEGR